MSYFYLQLLPKPSQFVTALRFMMTEQWIKRFVVILPCIHLNNSDHDSPSESLKNNHVCWEKH